MADILSQAEIDELLNALTLGSDIETQIEEKSDYLSAKPYNFKTANKFPKEQIRTLNMVFQNFAQLLSTQMTGILRTTCECELLSVEELSFNEFNNSLPSPVVLAILNLPPMQGSELMEISPEAAYMIINRLLGGSDAGMDTGKQFTEIEMALMERVLRQHMVLFEEAWEKIFTLHAQLERIETSTQFTQIVALNEAIAVITLNLKIGNEAGLITICIPRTSIEPVAKQLNTRLLFENRQEIQRDEARTEQMTDRLIHTPVEMTAYFEETPATVSDIINLQVGDVIRLNQNTNKPIMVKVQHIPKFYAKIGTSGSKYAVQIVDIIKEENEDESFTR